MPENALAVREVLAGLGCKGEEDKESSDARADTFLLSDEGGGGEIRAAELLARWKFRPDIFGVENYFSIAL
jgi:hypothetical protein